MLEIIDTIADPQIRRFLKAFARNRAINREFYELVPEEQFDFRMVDTPIRKADSPRESIAHQIRVQREYLRAIETGQLEFGVFHTIETELRHQPKATLLKELETVEAEMVRLLIKTDNPERLIEVPWSNDKLEVVEMLQGLHEHEVLHTGWNLAVMDHLGLERFPALRAAWG